MNNVPRFASAIVGLIFGVILALLFYPQLGVFFPRTFHYELPLGLFFGLFLGPLGGYASGALVAGIFLFTDGVVQWWNESARRPRPAASLIASPVANEPNSVDHRKS